MVYIEVLVLVLLFLLVVCLWFWAKISHWLAVRRYKPENDKGRLAEESRQRLIADADRGGIKREVNATARQGELKGQGAIPPTSLSLPREDSVSTRKTGGRISRLFKRR